MRARILNLKIRTGYNARALFTDGGRGGEYSGHYDRKHGNGMLSEYGAHMIDLARWLIGDIAKVNSNIHMFLNRLGPDGDARALNDFFIYFFRNCKS